MKRNRFIIIFSFFIVLLISSVFLGYQLMNLSIKDKESAKKEDINSKDEINIEIVREENRISPNTFIEERIHYKECGHLISDTGLAEDQVVNLTRDEYGEFLSTNHPNLRLVSFSNVKVVVFGERNHLCKEHFVVGQHNGYVAIFNIGDKGERLLFKSFTDYPISLLIDIDQEKLEQGIIVDNEEELSEILENFIS